MALNPRIGGSFAPPLTYKLLDTYRSLAKSADPEVKDYMEKLIEMSDAFNGEDESDQPSRPHPSGLGTITDLSKECIDRMFNLVPWPAEVQTYLDVFNKIPSTDQDARNTEASQAFKAKGGQGLPPGFIPTIRSAAHHLCWFAAELSEDRQPLTNDQLPAPSIPVPATNK